MTPAINFTRKANIKFTVHQYDHDESSHAYGEEVALKLNISRDRILEILQKENILARRYFFPGCHNMEPYKTLDPFAGKKLPETEKLTKKVLILPTGTSINKTDIQCICKLIKFVIANADEIKKIVINNSQ